jgi:multiple antibiotic resistance protein
MLNDLIMVPPTFQTDIITSVIALFIVIDPIGNIPLFIAFTKKLEKAEHKTVSKTAILTAAALLLLFGVAGTQILQVFGITIFSFMIAGGTLLFIIAIELLTYGEWRFAGSVKEEVGVVPIAFPLLGRTRVDYSCNNIISNFRISNNFFIYYNSNSNYICYFAYG